MVFDEKEYEKVLRLLMMRIPQEEVDRVMGQEMCDITPSFMGFIVPYYHLSRVIPEYFTVLDFGAGYNAQSYFFEGHRRYIAVEPMAEEMFQPGNCVIERCTTMSYLNHNYYSLDLTRCFAIANFVPKWHGEDTSELVRLHFKNCYTFNPQR